MIQGGDPAGTGAGDPGYRFKNETSPTLTFDRPGRLAYANAGPNTNGSQFFVTEVAYPSLNGGLTVLCRGGEPALEHGKKKQPTAHEGSRPALPTKNNHVNIQPHGAVSPQATLRKTITV